MAGIKQPLQDVLNRLAALTAANGDGNVVPVYTRIWNNQLAMLEGGETFDFPKPAFFVEIINGVQFDQIGTGFRSADLGFNIHIVHEFYDAGSGNFEDDLAVFDLRDQVVKALTNWRPTACGEMISTGESQDYDHNNLYHYVISFVCNFIDSKGSLYDVEAGNYTDSEPPVDLALNVAFGTEPVTDLKTYKPKI